MGCVGTLTQPPRPTGPTAVGVVVCTPVTTAASAPFTGRPVVVVGVRPILRSRGGSAIEPGDRAGSHGPARSGLRPRVRRPGVVRRSDVDGVPGDAGWGGGPVVGADGEGDRGRAPGAGFDRMADVGGRAERPPLALDHDPGRPGPEVGLPVGLDLPGRPGRANFREGVAPWPASHRAPRAGKAPGAGTRACAPMPPKSPAVSPDLHRPGLDPTPPKPPACTYWMIGGSPAAPPAGSPWPKDAAKTGSSERPPDASARSATWTPSDAPVAQRPQRRRQRHPRRGLGLPVLCRPGPGRGRPGRAAVVVAVAP